MKPGDLVRHKLTKEILLITSRTSVFGAKKAWSCRRGDYTFAVFMETELELVESSESAPSPPARKITL